ncbi:unnamed protein product [Linum trigynum]|uniref:Reverse transcriptase domain-containing protein n=1 Tax=Linum trigynum TaxID=586398 RepID=A0AAV2CCQ9_9ROSI
MGFDKNIVVDAMGFSGGIWVLWKSACFNITEITRSSQLLHVQVKGGNNRQWLLTAIYGNPGLIQRRALWEKICIIAEDCLDPWLLAGDFNSILHASEKEGGARFDASRVRDFHDCVQDSGLMDLGFTGPSFTWFRNGVKERLDRGFTNQLWATTFPEATVRHIARVKFDHRPILITTNAIIQPGGPKPFKFLAAWLTHEDFNRMTTSAWGKGEELPSSARAFATDATAWNVNVFGHILKKKAYLLNRIERLETRSTSAQVENQLTAARDELETILLQEEIMWCQKSRLEWISSGDRNTKYFHSKTMHRRKRNRITLLKDTLGVWVEEPEALLSLVKNFFQALYTDDGQSISQLPHDFKPVAADKWAGMMHCISEEEIQLAVRLMGSLKAPGIDGLNPLFFKRCWGIVGKSVVDFVSACWVDPTRIKEVNETIIVVIPKVPTPTQVEQFRPISLCNVTCKIVTKCLAERLKSLMQELVAETQTSFVPGRQITDNICILQEVVHSMRSKQGRTGWMVVKVDLAKAYDRIKWEFVRDTLQAAGAPPPFIEITMQCITSPSMRVQWNGGLFDTFSPSRGLRQGCPLSPYLFTLCMERLSHLISGCVTNGSWKPIRLTTNGPSLSHIFFVDDLILFGEASPTQITTISHCFETFSLASGQQISKPKSRVFFSKNVTHARSSELSAALDIPTTMNLGRYLGVPVIHDRISKATYVDLIDRIDTRLAGWKANTMSLAARITLVQSVLASLPAYTMQTSFLPANVRDYIDRKTRAFIWGSTESGRKIHQVDWETICHPIDEGELGLRSATRTNEAFMLKLAWRLLTEPESLWARVVRAKYLQETVNGLQPRTSGRISNLWRGVLRIWHLLPAATMWNIQSGRQTRFWTDRWLLDGPTLAELAVNLPPEAQTLTVAEMVLNGEWNVSYLNAFLTNFIVSQVLLHPVPHEEGPDIRVWRLSPSGKFSMRTAYDLTTEEEEPPATHPIWRAPKTKRVQAFLWLATQGRLLTNAERQRRHLTMTPTCTVCGDGDETVTHVLRDCPYARGVWAEFLEHEPDQEFFQADPFHWLLHYMSGRGKSIDATLFAGTCWLLWKNRNNHQFEGKIETITHTQLRTLERGG